MQRRHRQAHRLIWLVLSVALIGGFLAGVLLRPQPAVETLRFETGPAGLGSDR